MKIVVISLIILNSLFAFDIDVNITNIKSLDGKLKIALYDKKDGFLKEQKAYKKVVLNIKNKTIQYRFKNIQKGIYTIAMYHDENNNNKLDTNFFGIPNEGIGISNNATSSFGPPVYEEAKFEVKNNIVQNIKMDY